LFNQRSNDAYEKLQKKYEKCEEDGPTPAPKPVSKVDLDPTCMGPECQEFGPYSGYKMTQGKCRGIDKYSYNRKQVYNLKNTKFRVNTE